MNIDEMQALLTLINGGSPAQNKPPADEHHEAVSALIGKYVIVRSRDSGVHAGTLVSRSGRTVVLIGSRRLWYWVAAKEHTLSAVSLHGLGDGSKISSAVETIEILDACEIIQATVTAQASIEGYTSHDPS